MDLDRLFIHNLKKWRKIMGYSQKELAEKCNAAHSYMRQLESGKGHPSFAFIGKIADALQIKPYQLFYDEAEKPGYSARTRHIESTQKKLLEAVANDIQAAFDELKKY
ncbi:MAG: helix-turn-helix domain-containing protein [Treponema sp.]|jgi:transcriptional regulator with XRE-family HTH domain|nr:helix-turn-helix domain-containing protein [Treponema sp.]